MEAFRNPILQICLENTGTYWWMDMADNEDGEAVKFPAHKAGLSLEHNEHKNLYETLASYIDDMDLADDELTPIDKEECLKTDSLWVLQWFPDTPVGSYLIAGPTLERVMQRVEEFCDRQAK